MGNSTNRFDFVVVGAGIAGCSISWALTQAGFQVCLIDQDHQLASQASGNSRAAIMPVLTAEKTKISEFSEAAFSFFYTQFSATEFFQSCGLMQLAYNPQKRKRYSKAERNKVFDLVEVEFCAAERLSELAGVEVGVPGVFFPQAGWLSPKAFCQYLTRKTQVLRLEKKALNLKKEKNQWRVSGSDFNFYASQVVLCSAYQTQKLFPSFHLPIRKLRGQVVELESPKALENQKAVICFDGYLLPAERGWHLLGASYDRESDQAILKESDNQELWRRLTESFPSLKGELPHFRNPRASFRTTTPDHLPIAGEIERGLWILTGLGSRGFTYAPYVAHHLAQRVLDKRPMDFLMGLDRPALHH